YPIRQRRPSAILGATPVNTRRTRNDAGRRGRSRLRIRVRWSQMDKEATMKNSANQMRRTPSCGLLRLKGHADALGLLGKLKLLVRISSVVEAEIQSALRRASKISRMRFSISPQRRKEASAPSSRETKVITPPAKFRSC